MRRNKPSNELMQFTGEAEDSSDSSALVAQGGTALVFDYGLIQDVALRSFTQQKAVEIKRLVQHDRDLQAKQGRTRLAIGQSFIAVKEKLVAEESLWLDWLRDEFKVSRPTELRNIQNLMMIARQVQEQPELEDLAQLGIRDYLAAELLAPSTPDAARTEVLEAVIEAKGSNKPIAEPQRLVRGAIDRHKPKAASRSGSGVKGEVIAPPPLPTRPEIRSLQPANAPPPKPEAVTLDVRPVNRLEGHTLYALGEHFAWIGSTSDPKLMDMLPQRERLAGGAAVLLALLSVTAPVAVFERNGVLWVVSPDFDLMARLFDAWTERTGQKPTRLQPVTTAKQTARQTAKEAARRR